MARLRPRGISSSVPRWLLQAEEVPPQCHVNTEDLRCRRSLVVQGRHHLPAPRQGFFDDSTASGIGDFRGLTQKLDYLQDLGVPPLWLLPFYPSPLQDDGYDIADYRHIHPLYGTLGDFQSSSCRGPSSGTASDHRDW